MCLLALDKRRDLVTEILRKVKLEDEGVVIAMLTRDDKELGVSMSEGAAYSYPRRVCDELVHRGWAKRVA